MRLDTTFDGFERTASQAGNASEGTSYDPEKIAAARHVCEELAARFKAHGYDCDVERSHLPALYIHLGDKHTDPFKECGAIFKELKAIELAYEQGEKPLGDIVEASRELRISPRHRQPAHTLPESSTTEPEDQEQNKWQRLTQRSMVQGITTLAAECFPVGDGPVTEQQHHRFEAELHRFLSRGK